LPSLGSRAAGDCSFAQLAQAARAAEGEQPAVAQETRRRKEAPPLVHSSSTEGCKTNQTKVNTKDFQMYEINPTKIRTGKDKRTTVMVRRLTGASARTDFLALLERCGLEDKYTFFYMPLKEHRNVYAGFAFVNFNSSEDVLKLYFAIQRGLWKEVSNDLEAPSPRMSYARFQGHEELTSHFSSSAVLRAPDPSKRPIFRASIDKAPSDILDAPPGLALSADMPDSMTDAPPGLAPVPPPEKAKTRSSPKPSAVGPGLAGPGQLKGIPEDDADDPCFGG